MSLDWVKKRKKTSDDEEAKLNDALLEFQADFGQATSSTQPKTFLRGSVVEGNKTISNSASQGNVYAPKISLNLSKTSNVGSKDFDEAKKLAAAKARRMLEDAARSKNLKIVPKVVAPPTQQLKRPPKPGSLKSKSDKPKISNLETFKLELQRVQEDREKRKDLRVHLESSGINPSVVQRIAPEQGFRSTGEYDNDPYTTNIYVCNIPHNVTEEDLLFTFGSFGPLAALKILYPRNEEERRRPHICAFVAYMSRIDTDRFLNEVRIIVVRNEPIRYSLARPVVIPPTPYYIPPQLVQLQCPDPISGLPFNAQPVREEAEQFIAKYKTFPPLTALPTAEHPAYQDYMNMISNAVIRVVIPPSRAPLRLINRTAIYVITEGAHFEAMICAQEFQNPTFQFLWDNTSACHVYYRWRIYSLLQGDSLTNWRREKFRMFEGGSWWIPPFSTADLNCSMPECLYDSTCIKVHPDRWCHVRSGGGERRGGEKKRGDSLRLLKEKKRLQREEEEERLRKERALRRACLSAKKRDKLEKLIREITPEQATIGEAMVWCVENAINAKEICECIYESLTIDETPLHKKIARLYLISDILSNCVVQGVRDVFLFRKHFEELLEKIFESVGATYKSIGSRIKQEQFKQRVMNVFRHWEETALYPIDKLIHSQNVFLGLVNLNKKPESDEEDEDFTKNMKKSKVEEDYDDDLDGIPIGIDGEPIENQPKHQDDDEDIDGIPMDATETRSESDEESEDSKPRGRFAQNFRPVGPAPTSKWDSAKIDDIDISVKKSPVFDDARKDLSLSPGEIKEEVDTSKISLSSSSMNAEDEKRRKLMRDVEVRAMIMMEDLEADGDTDAKTKVDEFRKKEMEKVEKLMKEKESKNERKRERKDKESREKSSKKEKKRDRSRSRSRSRDRDRRDRDRDRDRRSHRDRSSDRDRRYR